MNANAINIIYFPYFSPFPLQCGIIHIHTCVCVCVTSSRSHSSCVVTSREGLRSFLTLCSGPVCSHSLGIATSRKCLSSLRECFARWLKTHHTPTSPETRHASRPCQFLRQDSPRGETSPSPSAPVSCSLSFLKENARTHMPTL